MEKEVPSNEKLFSNQVEIFVCMFVGEEKTQISHSKISELAATAYLVRTIFLSFNRKTGPRQIMTYKPYNTFQSVKGS